MEHSAGKAPRMKQRIALLGSTGSIGVQTLDIVRENSELFEITTLTAHRNWEALARQAEEFAPDSVVIADDSKYDALRRALADRPVKVYAGADAIRQVVQADTVDTVVNALVGYAGLLPTVAAIEAGKKVALANKETLVCAGTLVMDAAEKYGADALRFNLITGNSPGNDMRFYVEKCEAMRNFCNKIWNASRFVMMNLTVEDNHLPEALETEDKWILSKLNRVVKEVCDNMDSFELGVAAGKIYDFIWDDYCDWYIELTKPRLNGDDEAAKESAQRVLLYVLVEILKLLHPFMPFITEEIWQALPHEGDALMMQSYPEYSEALNFPEDEANFGMVMDAIKAVRARRSEMNVPPSRKSHLIIVTDKAKAFTDGEKFICKLAYASGVEVRAELPESTDGMVSVITDNARMFMPMAELVDLEKERARMEKELANAKKQLDGQNAKLANENFVSRAPEKVVNAEREKKAKLEALIENLEESLKNLG